MVALVLLGVTALVAAGQHARILELKDQLESDSTGEWGATVYWGIMREGESSFSLAYQEHNVITNAGRTALRPYIGQTPGNPFNYIGIGTGTGGGVGSTDLVTPFLRAQGTYATPSAYNFTITYTWVAGTFSGQTITEAALFNAASGPTMFNYQSFTGITLQSGDSLQVQFNVQVGS